MLQERFRISWLLLPFIVWISSLEGKGQVGGQRSFEFLHLPATAELSGLGGVNVTLPHQKVNAFLTNPSSSTDSLSGDYAVDFMAYFAGVHMTTLSYAAKMPKLGKLSFGLRHLSLGTLQGLDATGQPIGEWSSGETAFIIGKAHRLGPFGIGANLKWVHSNIVGFRANALMVDLGGSFVHPNKDLTIGMVFGNLGFLINDYTTTSASKLPLDIQLGGSFKPKHMPFRFSITAHQLYQGDISYAEPVSPSNTPNLTAPAGPGLGDKILRHFVFATELLLSDNFSLRMGYNALVRKELKLENAGGGAGFSYGLSFRIKSFAFAYSRGGYHATGGVHHLGIRSNITTLTRKNRIKK